LAHLAQERTRLNDYRQLDMTRKKVEEVLVVASKKVKLNVGGQVFVTSVETLTKEEDSMFAIMFSGRFPIRKDEDGEIFIDRSPQHFGVILNYLRTGLFPPRNMYSPFDYATLISEIEFYGICSLYPSLKKREKHFIAQYDFDTNGFLYWLGTEKGTKPYHNPASSVISVTRSSVGDYSESSSGYPEMAAGRDAQQCYTHNSMNSWFCFNCEPYKIRPNCYTLRHWSKESYAVRQWVLEGSVNGVEWEELVVHCNDAKLEKVGSTASWGVPDVGKFFSWFRVRQTGLNSAGNHYLMLSGFELYGVLEDEEPL